MMKPVNKLVYVLPDKPPERKGAILLPVTDMKQMTGIVRASDSELCRAGDRVAFARMWPIAVEGEELVVVHEKDLIGVDPLGTLDMSFEEAETQIAGSIHQ